MATYEDVLVDAIDLLERADDAAVDALLTAHPEHADRLRSHLSRLRALGLATATADLAKAFPERLGDFRLLRRLGSGGMGVVYLARQESLGREVALKLVRQEHLYFPGARERFRREVATIARLQHPGIVPVHDAGEDAGVPWLAMEHIVGASLDVLIKKVGGRDPATLRGIDLRAALLESLPAEVRTAHEAHAASASGPPFVGTWVTACLHLVRSVAIALHHAHQRGVLHRDLKPSNVMLTPDGRALLLDFGLALADGDARLTRSGSQLGTLAYMAPEQLRGDVDAVDVRSDVYSLGVTACELLTLQLPFAAGSDAEIRERVLAGRLHSLREHNRALPRDVETVLRKACDLDPGRRYGDAAAFAADLANLLELRPISAEPPGAWLLMRRWAQRHPARAMAIAAGTLLFLVAPTAFLLQAKAANREIRLALDVANEQEQNARTARDAARTQRDLAREAVDTMLARVADEQLLQVPRMQRVRRDLLERARSFYERFLAADPDDVAMLEQVARATLQMVFVDGELGQLDFAVGAADRAVELAGRLHERRGDDGDDEDDLLLADAFMTRGRVRLLQVRHEAALADFAASDGITGGVLAREPEHPQAIALRLGTERGRSLALRALDRDDEYVAALQRLADLWRRGDAATVGHECRESILDHVLCSGVDETKFLCEEGRLDEAREACERTSAIADAVHGEELPIGARVGLALLSVMRVRLAEDASAKEQEQQLLACVRDTDAILADNPDQAQTLRLRANVENGLGMLLSQDAQRSAEAMAWYERSLATMRRIVAADPTVIDNRANLAATLVNLGSQHKDAGRAGKALECFAEAERLAAECCAIAPGNDTWQLYLYNATWFTGQTCGDLRDAEGQAAAARRLAALRAADGTTQRIAAELLAEASALVQDDDRTPIDERTRRRTALETEALQHLALAAEHGYADHVRLREGGKLAPLRALPGFPAVLARVTANATAGR